jgi:deazaflavin-dependent oxidoreductase (nitroreductase family)
MGVHVQLQDRVCCGHESGSHGALLAAQVSCSEASTRGKTMCMSRLIVGILCGVLVVQLLRRGRQPDQPQMSGLLTEGVRIGAPSRLAFRTPGLLFDLGLGRLVSHRFLQLTHWGRNSGRIYRTILEVISYDPSNHECVVLSGWGERADWYRNIRATPALEVGIAGGDYVPIQRFLDTDELYVRLQTYMKRKSGSGSKIVQALAYGLGCDDGADNSRQR